MLIYEILDELIDCGIPQLSNTEEIKNFVFTEPVVLTKIKPSTVIQEMFNKNKKTSDRERIQREFERFGEKNYKKIVLMLEFGEKITDLIGLQFEYRGKGGKLEIKNTFHTIYSAVMSWKQPNNKDFDVIQSGSHKKLFWLFLQDCYYYFRNDIRQECQDKGLIEEGEKQ